MFCELLLLRNWNAVEMGDASCFLESSRLLPQGAEAYSPGYISDDLSAGFEPAMKVKAEGMAAGGLSSLFCVFIFMPPNNGFEAAAMSYEAAG